MTFELFCEAKRFEKEMLNIIKLLIVFRSYPIQLKLFLDGEYIVVIKYAIYD